MRLILLLILSVTWLPLKSQDFSTLIHSLEQQYLSSGDSAKSIKIKNLEKSVLQIAKQNFESYLSNTIKTLGDTSLCLAFLLHKQGVSYYAKRPKTSIQYNTALQLFEKALVIRKKKVEGHKGNRVLKEDLANNYYVLGATLYELKAYKKAIKAYKKALAIYQETTNWSKQVKCYHQIGKQHFMNNDVFEAKTWFEQALAVDPDITKKGKFCLDFGVVYYKCRAYNNAIKYLDTASLLLEESEKWKVVKMMGNAYDEMADESSNLQDKQVKYNKALSYYKMALNENLESKDSVFVLMDMGVTYLNMEAYGQAENLFITSNEIIQRTTPENKELKNIYYHNLAQLAFKQQRFKTSVQQIQNAINEFADAPELDYCLNPTYNQQTENLPNLLQDFQLKGKTYYQWYLKEGDKQHLDCAYNAYKVFNQLMAKMQGEYANEQSELFWLDEFYSTIETGLSVAYLRYNQSKKESDFQFIISLMEQNKANVLLENLKRNNALNQLKEDIRIPSIKDIKDNLVSENSALLNYFVGDSRVFVVCITASNHHVYQFPKAELRSSIQTLLGIVTEKPEDVQGFIHNSNQLYDAYVAAIINQLPVNIDELVIIPDGAFSYLPFSLLVKESPNSKDWRPDLPYLLKDYAITYGYSASLLIQHKSAGTSASPNVIGFAPEFDRFQNYSNLNNKAELNKITDHYPVTAYLEDKAIRSVFFNQFANNDILHLATHAEANSIHPDSSFIVFSDSLVYLKEIYQRSSNACMAVLSACETGVGNLQRGEGLFSLARAFTNAGIPSTTMSMWKVSDQATSQLMSAYYQYLSEGNTKHRALQKAKLRYMTDAERASDNNPRNWASFLHYGDPVTVVGKSNFNWWWLVMIVIIGGVLVFFGRRKING